MYPLIIHAFEIHELRFVPAPQTPDSLRSILRHCIRPVDKPGVPSFFQVFGAETVVAHTYRYVPVVYVVRLPSIASPIGSRVSQQRQSHLTYPLNIRRDVKYVSILYYIANYCSVRSPKWTVNTRKVRVRGRAHSRTRRKTIM